MRETSKTRSRIMRAVKSRDTQPEMIVRRLVHGLGYRFRICRKDLPGCPDIVFSRLRKVVFVHGCFWHGHECARGARIPKRNRAYWVRKVAGNVRRDQKHRRALTKAGWQSMVVWECTIRDSHRITGRLRTFLKSGK